MNSETWITDVNVSKAQLSQHMTSFLYAIGVIPSDAEVINFTIGPSLSESPTSNVILELKKAGGA